MFRILHICMYTRAQGTLWYGDGDRACVSVHYCNTCLATCDGQDARHTGDYPIDKIYVKISSSVRLGESVCVFLSVVAIPCALSSMPDAHN